MCIPDAFTFRKRVIDKDCRLVLYEVRFAAFGGNYDYLVKNVWADSVVS